MTSQQIEYVLTLAEEKSFSKAAQRLYVTQPSLSQFIKNLEKELHTQIFDRSTSPIRLTQAGEAFIIAARRIKTIEDELNQQIADLTDLKTGELRIGTSPFRASCLLSKSIAKFHDLYPGVTIDILEAMTHKLEEAALEGRVDLYLGTGSFDESIFHAEDLVTEQLYLAVPPDSPLNKGMEEYQVSDRDIKLDTAKLHKTPAVDLSTFQSGQFIFLKQNQKLYTTAFEFCQSAGFNPFIILYSERIETTFSWALAGIGCTFIPDLLIKFGNYEKHPIYYKLSHPKATRNLYVAYRKNRYLSRVAKEYIALLKQLIGFGTWFYQ